jgi:excisionase family DNA binding protein
MSAESIEDRIARVVRETLTPLHEAMVAKVVEVVGTKRPPEAEWLSTADVARELGVKVETVRAYVKNHKLKASRVERAIRVHRDDLRRFLAGVSGEQEEKVLALASKLRGSR